MKHAHYKIILLLIMMVSGSLSSQAFAEGEKLYFVGMVSPNGSISISGASSTSVYLRWDVTEGSLPADISEFKIMRDDAELFRAPAFGIMDTNGINALYAAPQNNRRFMETLRWLNAAENTSGSLTGDFATAVGNKLAADSFWAYVASRMDFSIARVRYRAYVDEKPPVGSVTYELYAISISGTEVRIGRVQLDTRVRNVLPAATDFIQVHPGRCDAPSERFKSHGTVALNWKHAGRNFGDAYVNSILVAGFDIYRDTSNVSSITARDIRILAAGQPHDSSGNVSIPGLEKVNDQPIMISGAAQTEEGKGVWKMPFMQFMETTEELAARGLKPGDTRAYYLVTRDMTGNYGNTTSLLVTVPDLNPPPAPWSIRTASSTAEDEFKLIWEQVNVANYYNNHKINRTYCNLDSARFDAVLRYVNEGKNCADNQHIEVDLKVTDYLVYRFSSIDDAAKFSDIDGDGYSDIDERGAGNTPGTACTSADVPAGKPSFLITSIPASSAQVRPSSRAVIEFTDSTVPRGPTKNNVFWYRVASRGSNGNISDLSEPIRGFFPERKKPSRGVLGDGFGVQSCRYSAKLSTNGITTIPPFALDKTREANSGRIFGDARDLRVSCALLKGGKVSWNFPFSIQANGEPGVTLGTAQCQAIKQQCAFGRDRTTLPFTTSYHSASGAQLAAVQLPAGGWNCSNVQRSELSKVCNTIQTVQPGEAVSGPLVFKPPAGFKDCVKFYRDINGKTYHYKTFCPSLGGVLTGPLVLDVPTMGGELTCLSAAVQNQNGEVSTKYRFPCVVIDQNTTLATPAPLDILFIPASNRVGISWLPPEQPLVGSIVEWYWKGVEASSVQTRFSRFYSHAGHSAVDGNVKVEATITQEQAGSNWEEEWCFRVRSVGQTHDLGNEALSKWSPEVCNIRQPIGQSRSDYLAWPSIKVPKRAVVNSASGLLPVRYLKQDAVPIVELSLDPVAIQKGCDTKVNTDSGSLYRSGMAICDGSTKGGNCLPDPGKGAASATIMQCASLCSSVQASMSGNLNFVAYRQSASDKSKPETFSDYVQVSPLIERAYCKNKFTPGSIARPTNNSILSDPFIKLADFVSSGSDWDGIRAFFVDRYPHILGQWYRYQFVRFDAMGEISSYQQTDWIQAKTTP